MTAPLSKALRDQAGLLRLMTRYAPQGIPIKTTVKLLEQAAEQLEQTAEQIERLATKGDQP